MAACLAIAEPLSYFHGIEDLNQPGLRRRTTACSSSSSSCLPSIRGAEMLGAVGDGAAGFPFKQTSHLASVRGVSCTAERSSQRSALGLTIRTSASQPRREDCQCAPTDEPVLVTATNRSLARESLGNAPLCRN